MNIEIRHLKPDELEASRWLGKYAFGMWTDDEMKPEDYEWVNPNHTLAAFVDGQLAAKVVTQPFEQVIRGVVKPMGGVAGVASYPEFRRRGLIRQLIHAFFVKMRADGQSISALYPFRENFYERYGYVTTNNNLSVKVETKSLAHHIPLMRQDNETWSYERKRARDYKLEWLAQVRKMGVIHHGFVFYTPESTPDGLWKRAAKDQHLLAVKQNGTLAAAARFLSKGYMDSGELTVREMYWQSPEARDRLLAYLASHADAVPVTWLPVPYGTNFHNWINTPTVQIEAKIGFVVLMGRVVDVVGALADLPVPVNRELVIEVGDKQCQWNNGRYLLRGENGRLSAIPTDRLADINMTIEGLSALIYGTLPAAEAEYRGWINGLTTDTRTLLDIWFPQMILFNTNHF